MIIRHCDTVKMGSFQKARVCMLSVFKEEKRKEEKTFQSTDLIIAKITSTQCLLIQKAVLRDFLFCVDYAQIIHCQREKTKATLKRLEFATMRL